MSVEISAKPFLKFALIAVISGKILALDLSSYSERINTTFTKEGIYPTVYPVLPKELLSIEYEGKQIVLLGNDLAPTQVTNEPIFDYDAEDDSYYTLSMIDPDAYSRQNPNVTQVKLYLVGNIIGKNVKGGDVLASYLGPLPPAGSGLHRYIFFVFKQPKILKFDEILITEQSALETRVNFHLDKFVAKYNLGPPIAGNFFQAQFQGSTPNQNQSPYY